MTPFKQVLSHTTQKVITIQYKGDTFRWQFADMLNFQQFPWPHNFLCFFSLCPVRQWGRLVETEFPTVISLVRMESKTSQKALLSLHHKNGPKIGFSIRSHRLLPVVMKSRIAIQGVWQKGYGWDEKIAESTQVQFEDVFCCLDLLYQSRVSSEVDIDTEI